MRLFRLSPITRKRLRRFKEIKRGYYSLIILSVCVFLSLFCNYIANKRAIVVYYQGEYYFPTYKFYDMETFGQQDEYGFIDAEAEYRRLKKEFQGTDNWVLLPFIPYDPYESDFSYDQPPPNRPDNRHWLGTDSQGRDVLVRLIYGFRVSIFFALGLVFASQLIGTILGSLQGYLGGIFDITSQRFIEVWSSLPFLYIVIIMATFFTPNFWMLLFLMALFWWISITYYMRTEMYREKTRDYCLAARAIGASHARIIFKHLLPNSLTPLVTLTPFLIVAAIGALTGLDYLGYGLPAPTPSWGELIDQALRSENRNCLWLSIPPFLAITFTLLLVTLIGESIREAFDPKKFAVYR